MIQVLLNDNRWYEELAYIPRVGEYLEISSDEVYRVLSVHYQLGTKIVRLVAKRVYRKEYDGINSAWA